jgi:succinyl-CoA synthetase beta subunit
MNLCEVDGKTLLARHGIAIPRGRLLDMRDTVSVDEIAEEFPRAVIKAQILGGGRGKRGLVRLADGDEFPKALNDVFQVMSAHQMPPVILVEERLAIAAELYLAFTINDVEQKPQMLFSREGGVDVEHSAQLDRLTIDPLRGLLPHDTVAFFRGRGIDGRNLGAMCRLATALYRVFTAEDAELLEINPLILTEDGRLMASDAKIVLDEAALFRHRGELSLSSALATAGLTPLEREAEEQGFTFVEMPGDIAIMSAGAGLGMMLVDLIGERGLRAACFVDGSAATTADNTEDRLKLVFKRATAPEVKAILFYQNLGTRDLKPRVEALLNLLKHASPPKPLYFGLMATYLAERRMTAAQACVALREAGYFATEDLAELIATVVRDVG